MRRILLALLLFLASVPALAAPRTWHLAESPSFRIYSDGSVDELRQFTLLLEDFDRLLRALTREGAPPSPNKLKLFLVSSPEDWRPFGRMGPGVGGFYSATAGGIAGVALQRNIGDFGRDEIMLHEYVHHFMLHYFPAAYPAWYVEGFAEYLAPTRFDAANIEYGRINANRAEWLSGSWIPMQHFLESDPGKADFNAGRFYAQSWFLVHWLMRDAKRRDALVAYLRGYGEGKVRGGLSGALGLSYTEIERQLKAYKRTLSFTRAPRPSGGDPPAITVTALPASADEALLLDRALRLGVAKNDRKWLLDRARGVARRFPEDPLALRTRARAEVLLGDRAAGATLVDGMLGSAPKDADLLHLRGMVHLVAGRADPAARAREFAAARPWFAKAHAADPDHFPTLYRYAESFSADPGYASENVQNILLLAHQLAPQVATITLDAAVVLATRGRQDEAKALLAPLAGRAHGGVMAEAARGLLAAVAAGKLLTARFYEKAEEE